MRQPPLATLLLLALAFALGGPEAIARPTAPGLFCEAVDDAPACAGTRVSCSYCHAGVPPELNTYGKDLKGRLTETQLAFPDTADGLRELVEGIATIDSDADGLTNGEEIKAGTLPGAANTQVETSRCPRGTCGYDHDYAYRRIWLSVCGAPPDFEDLTAFRAMSPSEKDNELSDLLDDCMQTNAWRGKDGVVWEIGHYKIRPIGNLKLGEDQGQIPAVDYYADYNLFVYTQIDGHDARDVLLADYAVKRSVSGSLTTYTPQTPSRLTDGIVMQPERRVGLLTSFWNLSVYLNYTGIARVLVAQAFNAFLGVNLALMQGLEPGPQSVTKFRDYDGKGVTRPECAVCHTTVDPLAYPFRNYNGLTGTTNILGGQNAPLLQDVKNLGTEDNLTPLSYALPRLEFLNQRFPGIQEMPEAGYILGQRVTNLKEWATVLVNSDQFAANTVRDYWRAVLGHNPSESEQDEFRTLWSRFKNVHSFSVDAMMHDLIKTNAFGGGANPPQ